mgnify:CR=1 FL=1
MVEYKPKRGEIVMLGGQVINIQRAERLISELQAAVSKAHAYENRPELHDIGLNEMALNHLLDPADTDYVLQVGVSYAEGGNIAREYLTEILRESEKYTNLDALVNAPDIHRLFDESEGITGFHVEIPESR